MNQHAASPEFAMSFTQEAVQLECRDGPEWQPLGQARFAGGDLASVLNALRKEAGGQAGELDTVLVIPDDQILYTVLTVPFGSDTAATIARALEAASPYRAEDLAFDWCPAANGDIETLRVAAVARRTLDEAEDFARAQGFRPSGFQARPGDDRFEGQPDFGPTRLAQEQFNRRPFSAPDLMQARVTAPVIEVEPGAAPAMAVQPAVSRITPHVPAQMPAGPLVAPGDVVEAPAEEGATGAVIRHGGPLTASRLSPRAEAVHQRAATAKAQRAAEAADPVPTRGLADRLRALDPGRLPVMLGGLVLILVLALLVFGRPTSQTPVAEAPLTEVPVAEAPPAQPEAELPLAPAPVADPAEVAPVAPEAAPDTAAETAPVPVPDAPLAEAPDAPSDSATPAPVAPTQAPATAPDALDRALAEALGTAPPAAGVTPEAAASAATVASEAAGLPVPGGATGTASATAPASEFVPAEAAPAPGSTADTAGATPPPAAPAAAAPTAPAAATGPLASSPRPAPRAAPVAATQPAAPDTRPTVPDSPLPFQAEVQPAPEAPAVAATRPRSRPTAPAAAAPQTGASTAPTATAPATPAPAAAAPTPAPAAPTAASPAARPEGARPPAASPSPAPAAAPSPAQAPAATPVESTSRPPARPQSLSQLDEGSAAEAHQPRRLTLTERGQVALHLRDLGVPQMGVGSLADRDPLVDPVRLARADAAKDTFRQQQRDLRTAQAGVAPLSQAERGMVFQLADARPIRKPMAVAAPAPRAAQGGVAAPRPAARASIAADVVSPPASATSPAPAVTAASTGTIQRSARPAGRPGTQAAPNRVSGAAVEQAIASAIDGSTARPGAVALTALTSSSVPPRRAAGATRAAVNSMLASAAPVAAALAPSASDLRAAAEAQAAAAAAAAAQNSQAAMAEQRRQDDELQAQAEARARSQAAADARADAQARAAAEARARAQAEAEQQRAAARNQRYQPPEVDAEPDVVAAVPQNAVGNAAASATVSEGIQLNSTQIIGTISAGRASRALVRLSNGRVLTLRIGDRINGGTISEIGDSRITYQKQGRAHALGVLNGQ